MIGAGWKILVTCIMRCVEKLDHDMWRDEQKNVVETEADAYG
jgi:hypothetical protein